MSDEIVENLKKPSAWFRILFMAGFVVALYVAGVVLFVLMLAQILFSLISGSDNINLRRLGAGLTQYVTQILAFLTYNSEAKPFPFAPFPLPEGSDAADSEAYTEYSAPTPTPAPTATKPAETEYDVANVPEPEPESEPESESEPETEPESVPPAPPAAPVDPAAKARRRRPGSTASKPRKAAAKVRTRSTDDVTETKNDV